jgi:hypothetical protein
MILYKRRKAAAFVLCCSLLNLFSHAGSCLLYELFAQLRHSLKQPAFLLFSAEILSFLEFCAAENMPKIEIKALKPEMFQTKWGQPGLPSSNFQTPVSY